MYEIKRVEDKNEQENFCSLCGIEYDADAFCYSAWSEGEFAGVSQFRIIGKSAHIFDVVLKDGFTDRNCLYLLGKATLNFVDLCHIKTAVFFGKDEELAKTLLFKKTEEGYTLSLEGYFESACSGH